MDDATRALIETEARSKSNMHRLDVVEKKLEDYGQVITSIQLLAQRMESMEKTVTEINTDVKDLKDAPGEWWKTLIKGALGALVGALVMYLCGRWGIV